MVNELIKEIRMDSGLTQEDLALEFNMTRSAISKYETGEREPSLEFLIKFSKFFNISIDYLIGTSKVPCLPSTLNQLDKHSKDTLKKLDFLLIKFKNKKNIDLVYSLLKNIENLM